MKTRAKWLPGSHGTVLRFSETERENTEPADHSAECRDEAGLVLSVCMSAGTTKKKHWRTDAVPSVTTSIKTKPTETSQDGS